MMVSPVTEIREKLGLSKSELASHAGISPPTLEYIEKGAYGRLPSRLIQILTSINPSIESDYASWQIQKRINGNWPLNLDSSWPSMSDIMHPHTEWRQLNCQLSVTHYAEALCIPRMSVQKVENPKTNKFPKDLEYALIMACGSSIVRKIIEETRKYNAGRK